MKYFSQILNSFLWEKIKKEFLTYFDIIPNIKNNFINNLRIWVFFRLKKTNKLVKYILRINNLKLSTMSCYSIGQSKRSTEWKNTSHNVPGPGSYDPSKPFKVIPPSWK